MESSQNSSDFQELLQQFGAERLPVDVSSILQDFFLHKPTTKKLAPVDVVSIDGLINSEAGHEKNSTSNDDFTTTESPELILDSSSDLKLVKSVTSVDIPDVISICDQAYKQYFAKGCGCERNCHLHFKREIAFEAHLDALDLDRYCASHVNHQHLLILGAMNALMNHAISTKKDPTKDRVNARTSFKFRGEDVCRKFFLFVFGSGEKRIKNVMKQFVTKGILPSHHENAGSTKALIKTEPAEQRRDALKFILNYAQQNAHQLPGRYVCKEGDYLDLYLLPNQANVTRRDIYERYEHACEEQRQETVSFALWNELWDLQFPNVMTLNDRGEVCAECRQYKQMTYCLESSKITATRQYLAHLDAMQTETQHYRTLLDRCREDYEELLKKTDLESTIHHTFIADLSSMHYTFDWFCTVSLPFTAQSSHRHSSVYLKSSYKVALFGVSIEPMRKFILYIIPEFVCHLAESLPNITISLMHHLFGISPFREKEAFVHFANNSVDQAKNGLVFSYFMWRTLVGLHDKMNISFLPSGHTRCWNDLFMGVFKKKLSNCQVNSLQDIKLIAERCAIDCEGFPAAKQSLIQAFLVGNDNEELLLPLYNWQHRLATINHLSRSIRAQHHHFQLDIDIPGLILCRKWLSSNAVSYKLIANEKLALLDNELPGKLHLEPLPMERRLYLYQNVRHYFEVSESGKKRKGDTGTSCNKLWECDPTMVMQSNTSAPDATSGKKGQKKEANVAKKTVPRCSYCNEVGHRESIFGKVRCPKKRKDIAILEPTPDVTAEPILALEVDGITMGIVTESTDETFPPDHFENIDHSMPPTTMITLVETSSLAENDDFVNDATYDTLLD